MKIKWRKIKESHKIPVIYSVAEPDRDVYPGSLIKKISDPGFGSASKNLIIFNPKNWFQALGKMI